MEWHIIHMMNRSNKKSNAQHMADNNSVFKMYWGSKFQKFLQGKYKYFFVP